MFRITMKTNKGVNLGWNEYKTIQDAQERLNKLKKIGLKNLKIEKI